MSVELFERYQEALRRGHVAASRGRLDEAIAAYREAAELAPDRAVPHTGIGNVLLRRAQAPESTGAPADDQPSPVALATEALAAFKAALARAPRDEAALDGRARALSRLGKRVEAAEILDVLSDLQERSGRLTEAADTARRALELAEQKARRRHVSQLTDRLGSSAATRQAEDALSKALRLLELAEPANRDQPAAPAEAAIAEGRSDTPDQLARGELAAADGAAVVPAAAEGADAVDAVPAAAEVLPGPEEPLPAFVPDGPTLMVEAEAALDAGDLDTARRASLAAALTFEREGSLAAALDACYQALAFAPGDTEVHLRLVELYLDLGWREPAADKLALLGRLTELDGASGQPRARIVSLAADHFPDDPRLQQLTA